MIPNFVSVPNGLYPLLPPGIYDATLQEVYARFAINSQRKILFDGLSAGLDNLFKAGCKQIFLDGSYVSGKPIPGDYDLVWDIKNVDGALVDPVLYDFTHGAGTHYQKVKYLGEYFPSYLIESSSNKSFVDFFQIDFNSGRAKGIIRITN
jgi:hypothetical protein